MNDFSESFTLRLQLLSPLMEKADLPTTMTPGAAGFDIRASIEEPILLAAAEFVTVPCGFAMEFPAGFECQVRPRSGLAARYGVTVLNSPGTIDSDYRGEVMVILINHGADTFVINPKERIAQLVFTRVSHPKFEYATVLQDTLRGKGGFGSTGR